MEVPYLNHKRAVYFQFLDKTAWGGDRPQLASAMQSLEYDIARRLVGLGLDIYLVIPIYRRARSLIARAIPDARHRRHTRYGIRHDEGTAARDRTRGLHRRVSPEGSRGRLGHRRGAAQAICATSPDGSIRRSTSGSSTGRGTAASSNPQFLLSLTQLVRRERPDVVHLLSHTALWLNLALPFWRPTPARDDRARRGGPPRRLRDPRPAGMGTVAGRAAVGRHRRSW